MPENASAFVTLHTAICRTNNLKIVGLTYTPVMDTQRTSDELCVNETLYRKLILKQPVLSFKQQMQSLMTENGQGYAFWMFRQPSLRE